MCNNCDQSNFGEMKDIKTQFEFKEIKHYLELLQLYSGSFNGALFKNL